MIFIKCIKCGKKIKCISISDKKNRLGSMCKNCYMNFIQTAKPEEQPNWKGGKTIRNGYVFIRKPRHPFACGNGYIREHRLIMEESIGRLLKPNEIVHHINGNRLDNRIENLFLITSQAEHIKYHPAKINTCEICGEKNLARNLCKKHYWTNFLKEHRKKK